MSAPTQAAVADALIETATAAADAARRVAAQYFRAALDIEDKSDRTPVTIADRESERRIKEVILSRHPDHSVLGEEGGVSGGGDEWRWVIDPIDGTKSFATGNPTFGALIALLHRGRPLLGVIDHAALDERWLGVSGRATMHAAARGSARCRTSAVERLAEASLYATTPDMFGGADRARFDRLSAAMRFRVFGGDCYAYGLLARGFTDLVCEAQLRAHDFLALIPVIEGAGGVITDWRGDALSAASNGEVLAAANPRLHRAALAELNRE